MASVQLKRVAKHYQEAGYTIKAVDNMDLSLEMGDFAVVAGPSGSGKSTLLNLIGGLDRPDAGEIFFNGEEISKLSDSELTHLRLLKIGFVFQAYNLLPVLTAYENVQFPLQIRGIPEKEHKGRIMPILEELGLGGMEHRFPTQLSGGQQQRVAVARAIASDPSIILADEPTANLDSESSVMLLNLMKKLNEEKGVTFLFSSHDPLVIETARRVIRIRDGQIRSDDRKEQ